MFIASHATTEHSISLPLSAAEAFPLFTPEGERLWIEEWNPHYFHPANGETIAGMVFTTGNGEEKTYWTLVDFDNAEQRARYSRVTPGSRSVTVEVACEAIGEHETRVTVRYTLTGLSEAGNAAIAAFVEGYGAMIEDWRTKILAYIDRSNVRILP
jgi:hypothetical protein